MVPSRRIDKAWARGVSKHVHALRQVLAPVLGDAVPPVDGVAQAVTFACMFHPGHVPPVPGVPIEPVMERIARAGMAPAPAGPPPGVTFEDAYQAFLAVHDPETRRRAGVFYTPPPVVSFITRAVDRVLARDYLFPSGLSDPRVLVFDPAAGAGTFLEAVLRIILDRAGAGGDAGPLVLGTESMPAPAVHASIVLDKLASTIAARGVAIDRPAVSPGNSLSREGIPRALLDPLPPGHVPVILGNPPYSVSSANKGHFVDEIMVEYKKDLDEKNKQPLSDDYIKFLRLAHWLVERQGRGIVAFIINNAFTYKTIHRVMRASLLSTFDAIHVLDLHGNANIGETAPDGSKDENVFDVKIGTAIVILVKQQGLAARGVFHHDCHGTRDAKLAFLSSHAIDDVPFQEVPPRPPRWSFVPVDDALEHEYAAFPPVRDVFGAGIVGVKTHRDDLVIGFTRRELGARLAGLRDASDVARFASDLRLKDTVDVVGRFQARFAADGIDPACGIPYLYRPFDVRCLHYGQGLVTRDRARVARHMLAVDNVALLVTRLLSGRAFSHVLVTRLVADIGVLSSRTSESAYIFPLFVHDGAGATVNLAPAFVAAMRAAAADGTLAPVSMLHYILAVLQAPSYGRRYITFLKDGFPRVPVIADPETTGAMIAAGRDVASALLAIEASMARDLDDDPAGARMPVVDGPRWSIRHDRATGRVHLGDIACIDGVPEVAWNFQVGNYTVLRKWLRSRQGRILSDADINTFRGIVNAILAILDARGRADTLFEHALTAGLLGGLVR